MADYQVMGGMPAGYSDILRAAQQQLVRMPDGTLAPAPQFGGNTSLEQIYGGILPTGPTTRQVQTMPVSAPQRDGSAFAGGWGSTGFVLPGMNQPVQTAGARPAVTEGQQPAGSAQMPPGVRPASVDRAFAALGINGPSGPMGRGRPPMPPGPWDPFGTQVAKDESRLPTNAGEQEFLSAFFPPPQNPAVGAIDQAAGGVPMPRPRPPVAPMPRMLPPGLRGGLPSVPAPRGSSLGSITFKKGDTVWDLARDRGMTVGAFADLYGIANPNKIKAGQTVVPQVPIPRSPPPQLSRHNAQQAEFERRGLNSFGMLSNT